MFQDGYTLTGKVITRDRADDLVIIKFEKKEQRPIGFEIYPSHKVTTGQEIFYSWIPYGVNLGRPIEHHKRN